MFKLQGKEKADKEKLEKEMAIEKAIENDDIYVTPSPTPDANATWAEMKELEVRQLIENTTGQYFAHIPVPV